MLIQINSNCLEINSITIIKSNNKTYLYITTAYEIPKDNSLFLTLQIANYLFIDNKQIEYCNYKNNLLTYILI